MIQEFILEKNGKRRKAERVECQQCGVSFLRRAYVTNKKGEHTKQKYCSPVCSGKSSRIRIEVDCAQCGVKFEKLISKLGNSVHGVFFCNRRCKDLGQSIHSGKVASIRPKHYGTGKYIVYQNLVEGNVCEGCGEDREFALTVHHKDGDHENHVKDNLELVCWNCHCERHLRQGKKGWVVDFKSLTPRELLGTFKAA